MFIPTRHIANDKRMKMIFAKLILMILVYHTTYYIVYNSALFVKIQSITVGK
jgi:hypothetical protein